MASPFLSSPTPHHRSGEHTHSGSKQRPTFEVADILRAHLPDSLHEHSHPLPRAQGTQCHPKLPHRGAGRAHRTYCTDCGTLYNSYNSCRDRPLPEMSRGWRKRAGSKRAKTNCCRCPIFIPSSRCRMRSTTGWGGTDKLIYDLLFASATDTPASLCRSSLERNPRASPPCCTPGARRWSATSICTASSQAEL